jgi:tRNA(Arg) A34 adenosine deaminase TadA
LAIVIEVDMRMKWFDLARKLSKKSDHQDHKLGCVIVKGSKVIGLGFNKLRTSPRAKTRYNRLHAEVSALLNSGREDLTGCEAYIYRETKLGVPACSRPCPHCMSALILTGIKKICYSDNGSFKEERI